MAAAAVAAMTVPVVDDDGGRLDAEGRGSGRPTWLLSNITEGGYLKATCYGN